MAKVTLDGHEIDTLVLTPESGTAVSKSLEATNTYSAGDAGKVVKQNGSAYELAAQTARSGNITANDTYDTTENNSVTVAVPASAVDTGTKNITANGTGQDVVGYAAVDVAVPNSYSASDAGKVVKQNGGSYELEAQTARSGNITANGTYDTTENNSVTVAVEGGSATLGTKNISANGTYAASSDNLDGYSSVAVAVPASAVDSGTKNITSNGSNQDVVGYAAVDVAVPNSYSASDEGKVVKENSGSYELVAQTARSSNITENGTYDTTENNSVTVAVSGGGGSSVLSGSFTPTENVDTWTITELIGTTLNHFLVKAHGNIEDQLNHNMRVCGPCFIEFTSGSESFFSIYSSSTGNAYNGVRRGSGAPTNFTLNRTTGVLTVAASTDGYFYGGATYDWWAW